jgi:hypothetical protein
MWNVETTCQMWRLYGSHLGEKNAQITCENIASK